MNEQNHVLEQPSSGWRIGPPLVLFVCMHLFLWLAAAGADVNYFNAKNFAHWDGVIYLGIASHWYDLNPCNVYPHVGWSAADWCGNAGWMPGYPLLVRTLLHIPRIKPATAGILVSSSFYLATLVGLWNWLFKANPSLPNMLSFGLAGFFPGNIYYAATFPVSMFLFFVVLSMAMFLRRKYALAGLAGGVAAFTYSTGFLLAPVVAIAAMYCDRKASLRDRVRWAFETSGLVCAGFVCTLLVFHYSVGRWNAFFLVQRRYQHGIHNPLTAFLAEVHPFTQGTVIPVRGFSPVAGFQSFFVAGLLLLLFIYFLRYGRHCQLDCFAAVYMVTFWVVPLVIGGTLSLYRAESLLLPTAVLARRLPPLALAILLGVALLLTVGMGALFFRIWLV
jgi:hypothetical protein